MTFSLCIDSSLIGTDKNLLVDNGYKWVEEIPENAWHFSGDIKFESNFCFDSFLRLNHVRYDCSPPVKFVKAMSQVFQGPLNTVPWSQVMPAKEHRSFVKNIINLAIEANTNYSNEYYLKTWVPESYILRALVPAKTSQTKYQRYHDELGNNSRTIEGFRPIYDGYANRIEYDRFNTRTGRLTVSSGPNILTLKRSYRDVIIPSANSKIIYLDFSALEARIALYEAGGECDEIDLYEHVRGKLFDNRVSRKSVKIATISELYGSGRNMLKESLGTSDDELDRFISLVKEYFKIEELKNKVKTQFVKDGFITNKFQRRVQIDEPIDRIFINSYIQSTGVDVSLLGFSEIMRNFEGIQGVRPIFVLHDALILDVSEKYVRDVMNVTHVKIPGYYQKFPLKGEIFEHCV